MNPESGAKFVVSRVTSVQFDSTSALHFLTKDFTMSKFETLFKDFITGLLVSLAIFGILTLGITIFWRAGGNFFAAAIPYYICFYLSPIPFLVGLGRIYKIIRHRNVDKAQVDTARAYIESHL